MRIGRIEGTVSGMGLEVKVVVVVQVEKDWR